MSLEEQLRNDAQSLREVGWFNRAIMMDAAANEIQKLNDRIKRLEEARTVAAANSLATMMSYEDAIAKIKQLENLGKELRECASQLGWTSSEDPRWLKRAEAAVEAWDKFNKETKQ